MRADREAATRTEAVPQAEARAGSFMVADAAVLARLATSAADAGSRERALVDLQRGCGNRELQRLARSAKPSARLLQRETAEEKWAKAGPAGDKIYKLLADLLTPDEISGLLEKVPDATGDRRRGGRSRRSASPAPRRRRSPRPAAPGRSERRARG